MAAYAFDVYPAADPAGKITGTGTAARLVRLTIDAQLVSGWYKHVGFGLGEGEIQIHTDHAAATEANIAKRNYVMFVRTDVATNIGGFFLEDGDFDALSSKERGGRVLTFGGPGSAFMLDRYTLGHAVYATGQPSRGDWNVPDQWTWSQEPYGAMLLRCLEEGKDHPSGFFDALTWTFTRTRDSNNLLWDELSDYETPIGTNVMALYADLLKLGLVSQVSADLVVNAYRNIDEYRTDRTSAVFAAGKARFAAGVNIVNDMPRRIAASQQRTHVLIRDRTGDYQTVAVNLAGNPISGVPYMTYLKSDTTADDAAITKMGKIHLTRRDQYKDQATVRHIIGSGTGQYAPAPGGDYWVLDLVTLHTGTAQHDFNETPIEVASIRYYHDEAGNWFAESELGAQYIPPQIERWQRDITSTIRSIPTVKLCASEARFISMDTGWKTLNIKGVAAPAGWSLAGFDDAAWSPPATVYADISAGLRMVSGPAVQQVPSDEILIRREFWVAESDLSGAAVAFKYALDNGGRIYVNGVEVASLLPLFTDTPSHYQTDHATTLARSYFQPGLNCIGLYVTNDAAGSVGATPPGSVAGGVYIDIPVNGTSETGSSTEAARCDKPVHATKVTANGNQTVQEALDTLESASGVTVLDETMARLVTRGGFLYAVHRDNAGDYQCYLLASEDGDTFTTILGPQPLFTPITTGAKARDPSITFWRNAWWLVHTGGTAGSGNERFTIYKSVDLVTWTGIVSWSVAGSIPGVTAVWAPEFFRDPANPDARPYILFAGADAGTTSAPSSFALYIVQAANDALSSWSAATAIGGTGFPAECIDPYLAYLPGDAQPYRLFWTDDGAAKAVGMSKSASISSGYTLVSADLGWSATDHEAPCVIDTGDGRWRAYYNQHSGLSSLGAFYRDSVDDMATWGGEVAVTTPWLEAHGSVIRIPFSLPDVPGITAHSALSGLAVGDDHPQYQRESEKGAASGYASLDAGTRVPFAQMPRERARVSHSVAQSIATSTITALAFDGEQYDIGGLHDTATNNSRLTAVNAGHYSIGGTLRYALNATGQRMIGIRLNGTTVIAYHWVDATAVIQTMLSITTDYELAANDYVELITHQNSGAALNVEAVAEYSPRFWIRRND